MEQEFEAKEKKRKEREALGEWAEEENEEEYLVSDWVYCVVCEFFFVELLCVVCRCSCCLRRPGGCRRWWWWFRC